MNIAKFLPDHLIRMTDDIGILEHCIFTVPDKTQGYTTDDNARALQVSLRLDFPEMEKLSFTYLKFIISARTKKGFHNDLDPDLSWKDDGRLDECFGRAMEALAETSLRGDDTSKLAAVFVFDQMSPLIRKVSGLRTIAHLITGLRHRIKFNEISKHLKKDLEYRKKLAWEKKEIFGPDINPQKEINILADRLIESYRINSDELWRWYENSLAYDNGRLPVGLLDAYQISGRNIYKKIALESLNFLLEKTYNKDVDCFSFPGYKGWFPKTGKPAIFGQQPIEAGSTTEACLLAYKITREKSYYDFGLKAFEWYSGRNINTTSLYDNKSKGIKDGLESWGVNPNEGAESILGYALAYNAIKKAGK